MKKVRKIRKLRVMQVLFTIMLIVSFFMSLNVFAETKAFNIGSAVIKERTSTASGDIESVSSNEVENNVVFHKLGDYVVYKINIKSNLNKELTIISIEDDNTNGYIAYDYDKHLNEKLGANESFDFEVKATYKNELNDISKRKQENSVRFTIKYEAEGEQKEETIDIVPKTFDSINVSFILLIVSVTGLVICIALDKKKHKKGKVVSILLLLLVPLAIKADTFTYDIAIVTDLNLYDKQVVTVEVNGEKQEYVVPYNNYLPTLPEPSKNGYTFAGWKYSNGESFDSSKPISEDTKIIASFNPIEYDITYTLNGGSLSTANPSKYTIEDVFTLNNPSKNYYNFVGWDGTDLTSTTTNVTIQNKTGNRSYEAKFVPTTYQITYNLNGGTVATANPTSYTIESENITLNNPSKEGYNFIGWTGSNGNTPSTSVSISAGSNGAKTYTANYEVIDYGISYDYDGGTVSVANPTTYNIESGSITLNNPSKEGYTFTGWTGTGLSEKTINVTIPANSTGIRSYTANFEIINYSITYNGLEGSESSTVSSYTSYTVNTSTFTIPNIPNRLDGNNLVIQEFLGWDDGSGTAVKPYVIAQGTTGNKSLTAIWKDNDDSYSITYDLNGGALENGKTNPNTYKRNTDTFTLNNPVKEGYTFAGWTGTDLSGATTTVTIAKGSSGARTYTATYTPVIYSINYFGLTTAEETALGYPLTYTIEDTPFTLPNPSDRTDSDGDVTETFDGWDNGTTTISSITLPDSTLENKNYTAVWSLVSPMVYNITYTLNGGSVSTANPTTFTKLTDTFTLNNPTKTGYTFKGWSGTDLTGDENTTVQVVKGTRKDLAFTANYTANTYNVIFDGNDASVTGSMSPQEHTYDSSLALNTNTLTRTGYIFQGWNTQSDGLGTHYDDGETVTNLSTGADITLYAEWLKNTATVTFDSQGGSSVSAVILTLGESLSDKLTDLPEPTKSDLVFGGWYEDLDDENTLIDLTFTPADDVTVHAKWIPFVCRKATSLHTESCNSPSGKGCIINGHTANDTITYGEYVDSDVLKVGDALDCDVNGSGYNQRFYYVTDNGNNAVLISYTTYSGHDVGQSDINVYYNYDTSLTLLPTAEDWNNLPVKLEIQSGDYRPARFIRLEEIEDMTGITNYATLKNNGVLFNYEFLFENSLYSGVGERSTAWLEQTNISGTDKRIRYRNDSGKLEEVTSANYDSSKNCIKPVIEVPYSLIDDSYIVQYNALGGTAEYNAQRVARGDSLGTLPTATYTDKYLDGWYTSNTFITKINENRVPTGYEMYYAKWNSYVDAADIDSTNISMEIGDSTSVVINNLSDIEPISYYVLDDTVVSVNSDGDINALDVGTTKIIVTGLLSGHTREIDVEVRALITTYNVTFDAQGGTPVPPMQVVNKNTEIGPLPDGLTKTDFDFAGWYTTLGYTVQVTEHTVIDGDKTFYAKWLPSDAVAEINGTYYTTLEAAFDDVPTTNTKTTITLLKDVTLSTKLDLTITSNNKTNRDVVLDLNGKTLSTESSNVIDTKIKSLEVKNGTVTTNIDQGDINVQSGGKLIVRDAIIENTNSRQGIYNNGGTVEIYNSTIKNKKDRAAIQNLNNGTVTIYSGNVYSTEYAAIKNDLGTVNIGVKDGVYDTSLITIRAGVSTITNNDQNGITGTANIYDGMIMGKKYAINNDSNIQDIEDNATKVKDQYTDPDDGVTYNRLYYTIAATTYKITLDPDGGDVEPTFLNVTIGDQVGTLPTPTKGIYTFDGWYTSNDELVTSSRVPTSNETYTAHWSYTPSDNIVNYRTTNDAMVVYYNSIGSWKNSSSNFPSWSQSNKSPNWNLDSTENTVMLNNFNSHNCMCADNQCSTSGTVMCDKPKGYSTGFNEQVNVYLSDENKTIGNQVTYAKADNGTIYNLIPNQVYYWELDSDPNIHGYVRFTGERRILDAGDVRNMRDLGGLPVEDSNGNIVGHLAYERLYRGIRLSSSSSVTELQNLGINSQLDLREANSDSNKLSRYNRIEAQNYYVNPENYDLNPTSTTAQEKQYYTMTRNAVKYAMEEIVAGKNLYFHCRIGTDRTGTVAYVLEGLLGVPDEDRIEDYELSFFYGLVRVHRYHNEKPGSSVGTGKERFTYMYNFMPTNQDIYDWFMYGSSDTVDNHPDQDLIDAFRQAMIESN